MRYTNGRVYFTYCRTCPGSSLLCARNGILQTLFCVLLSLSDVLLTFYFVHFLRLCYVYALVRTDSHSTVE